MSYPIFVPNFKMLGTVVPEKSLTKKKLTQTNTHKHTHTEKAKTIYPLYTSYTGGLKIYGGGGGVGFGGGGVGQGGCE